MCGALLYLFFATSVGIFLATIARTMPQLGLLYLLVAVPLNLLSGANTPLEAMPPFLRTIMQASPSTHFVAIAQAILYRGAGFDLVWPHFLAVALIGGLFLAAGLWRFGACRRSRSRSARHSSLPLFFGMSSLCCSSIFRHSVALSIWKAMRSIASLCRPSRANFRPGEGQVDTDDLQYVRASSRIRGLSIWSAGRGDQ